MIRHVAENVHHGFRTPRTLRVAGHNLRYQELTKNPLLGRGELESVVFDPSFGTYQKVTLSRKLRSQDGGASEIEMGIGLAVLIERITPGPLSIAAGKQAFVRIDDVEIQFVPRPRNDDVNV